MVENNLILTVQQARDLQKDTKRAAQDPCSQWVWPGKWSIVVGVELPPKANNLQDPDRVAAALAMMDWGAEDEQIAEALMWRPRGLAIRQTRDTWTYLQRTKGHTT